MRALTRPLARKTRQRPPSPEIGRGKSGCGEDGGRFRLRGRYGNVALSNPFQTQDAVPDLIRDLAINVGRYLETLQELRHCRA